MKTLYVQFKLLAGTTTRKVTERQDPPSTKPHNAKEYRYFELEDDIPEYLANQYQEKDMIIDSCTDWKSCEPTFAEMIRP
jgi:hypothetical protein